VCVCVRGMAKCFALCWWFVRVGTACLDFSPPSEVWLSGFSEQLIPQQHTYRHSATNKSPLTMAAPPDSLQFTDEDLSIAKGAIFVWAWWCVSVCVCAHVRLALLV
jgi:hypothetical protein